MNKLINQILTISGLVMAMGCNGPGKETPDAHDQPTSDKATSHHLTLDAVNPVTKIQPTMYGIFFEDINFAADGGLYAEMVKNRSFEFEIPDIGWSQPASNRYGVNAKGGFGTIMKDQSGAVNAHFMRVTTHAETGYRLVNSGFRGMGVKKDLDYRFSINARVLEGSVKLRVQLLDTAGVALGEALIPVSGKEWNMYSATIHATGDQMKATLNLQFEGVGVTDVDLISLFPSDTWKDRPKGLRRDLVQLLADLHPGFLRFPGGCIVEGRTLARRYQWKKTVGPIEDREVLVNRWNTEFSHRPAPDYYQSFGLGFFEYFQLAEDLGAEPLPILSCGMACQYNTGELVPLDELDPYIQDALDLIEFANGPADKGWGKIRAGMGHTEPFHLKLIGVGNEQWGTQYIERYKLFAQALQARYPEIQIVSGSGPSAEGESFEYGWEELRKLHADIIDEHYYKNPEWFLENAGRYDNYDRSGPKVFAGEYAAQSVAIASPDNKNNWKCALSEAAFITGLERNADVVYLSSYAPLFAHADAWQWTPDLIWFNNLQSYGTPNYYVQQLFSKNKGTHVLNLQENGKPLEGENGLYATASLDSASSEVLVKLVNVQEMKKEVEIDLGVQEMKGEASITVLTGKNPDAVNSFETPENISPVVTTQSVSGHLLKVTIEPGSFAVVRVALSSK